MKKKILTIIIVVFIFFSLLGLIVYNNKSQNISKIFSNINRFNVEESYLEVGKSAKIISSVITKRKTGVGPFDAESTTDSQNSNGSIKWTAGNDISEDDNIVRSFDQITWTIENTMSLKENATMENFKGGKIEVKAILPSSCANLVKWDLESMTWAESAEVSTDGTTFTAKYSMSENDITVPGKQTLVFVLNILGAPNGLEIEPTFLLSLTGNEDNEIYQIIDTPVIVSATSKYDIVLTNYNNGSSVERNGEDKKIYKYGLAFRLLGDNASKGLKGIETPTGDLTFDIEYNMKRKDLDGTEYTDISDNLRLYNYKYNLNNSTVLGNKQNIISDLPSTIWFSAGIYPYSSSGDKRRSVYKNGNLVMNDNGQGNISVTISDYAISLPFPDRTDWGSYSNNTQYSYSKNIGFISVGLFYIEVDMNAETMKNNTQSYIELEAKNIRVNTVGNNLCTVEKDLNNNKITANHIIYGPGSYSKEIHLYSESGSYLASPWGAGNSSIYMNNRVQVHNRIILSGNNDKKDWIYGIDCLTKFDDKALEPVLNSNGNEYTVGGDYGNTDMTFNILYAGKKDKTGWTSDTEMIETKMEDLVYFDTLDELKSQGYVCVATMAESQSGVVKSGINIWVRIPMIVKSTAPINNVAQTINDVRIYNEGNVPDRTVQTHLKTTNTSDYPTIKWKSENLKYKKTEYDEGGQIKSGTHGGGVVYGNSLLILGAKQSIGIKAIDDNNSAKVNYDIGKNENQVKYQITPVLTVPTTLDEPITNITLKVKSILSKGLTYAAGSCEYGDPEITVNDDGTTTLVWYKYNCTVNEKIEPIIYKANINEESTNGTQYETKAIVEEVIGEDGSSKIGNTRIDERTSSVSIQIINLSSYSLYKTTETPVIEINGIIHYKITAINKTDDPIPDFQLLDILPYNGDNRGTVYNGTYTVDRIEMKQTNTGTNEIINNDNLRLAVTENTSIRTGVTAKDENLGTTSIWQVLTSGVAINKALTAYAVTGEIGAKSKLEVDIYLKTNGNKPYDNYKNSATAQTNKETELMETSVITVQDVKRNLEGYIWFDSNKDGLINEGEKYLSNVNVTLLKEDGTPAQDIHGAIIKTAVTDANGYYHFEDMERGNYKVKIEVTDDEQEITLKEIGTNKEINNKFNRDGTTDVITSLDNVESPIITESNVNAGITYKDTSVLVHHYVEGSTTKLSEDVVINGKIKDEYTTSVAEDIPEYYELVSVPTNAEGEMTLNQIEVTYYYRLKKYSYEVNYLEKGTNEVLQNKKIVNNITYGTNINYLSEKIDIIGYNYNSVDKEILTIGTSNNIINIYYTKGKFNYTVEYYYDGVIDNSKTETKTATYQDVIENYIDKNITGYRLMTTEEGTAAGLTGLKDGVLGLPLTITENSSNNVIKIYYVKDQFNYTVEYYYDGIIDNSKTETIEATYQDVIKDYKDKNITGYRLMTTEEGTAAGLAGLKDGVVDLPLTITEKSSNNVIKVYYVKDQFNYTVEYYYDGIIDNSKTETKTATYQDVIENYADKNIIGYRLMTTEEGTAAGLVGLRDGVVGLPLTITEKSSNNIIKVYYVKDKFNYTVEYYYDGIIDNSKTETKTATYQEVIENYADKNITGYRLMTTEEGTVAGLVGLKDGVVGLPLTITENSTNNIIKVYYVKDQFNYTVEYYYDGIIDNSKTETKTATYQDVIENYADKNITGYRLMTTEEGTAAGLAGLKDGVVDLPLTITEKSSNNVIKVYYVKDQFNYTVEYYYDGIIDNSKTETLEATYQDVIENYADKNITGYRLMTTEEGTAAGLAGLKDGVVGLPLTITEKSSNNVIKVYYVKDQFNYTVEYYYDGEIDESKTEVIEATYQDIIKEYTDKNITGYKLEKEENVPLTITEYETLNVIKIYYVKDKFPYVVEYYYDGIKDGTKTEIYEATYQDIIDKYEDKIRYGYRLEKVSNIPLVVSENVDINIINVYYVKRDSKVVVKYVDKNTGKEISEEIVKTGKVFDKYDISGDKKEIEGYTLIESPEIVTGTFEEETQTFIYYYAKNTNVIIKYLEKDETPEDNTDNLVLADEIILSGYEGKEYSSNKKDISNYTFVENTENTEGVMTREEIEVIYYYLQNTSVIVNHIDKNTGEKLKVEKEEGLVGDRYTASAKDFENYILIEKPEEETVIMQKEEIILNYYYVHISAGVIEKHVDIVTNEILYNELHEGNEGDAYSTNLKEFDGYDVVTNKIYYTEYVKNHPEILAENGVSTVDELLNKKDLNPESNYIPENAEGTMTVNVIEVTYYYIRKASVKVEYIDKITGEKIAEIESEENGQVKEKDSTEIITGHQGDNYETEEKKFEGYDILKENYPENAKGKMEVTTNEDGTINTEIVVRYYYVKIAGGVKERHIDIKTGELIESEKVHTGHEGDKYNIPEREFEGYDIVTNEMYYNQYVKDHPEILEENEVTTVEGLLEKLGILAEDGYVPENSEGIMTVEEIIVNYYYIRKAEVIVEYIDKITGDKIPELVEVEEEIDDKEEVSNNTEKVYVEKDSTEIIKGHEGDSYTTKEKEFKNYVIVKEMYPENVEGEMKVERKEDGTVNVTTYVRYYYVHESAGVVEKHIDIMTEELLEGETKYTGYEGDEYKTTSKSFEGYDLVEKYLPENAEGKMTIEKIEVKYYYIRKTKVKVEYLEIGTNKKLAAEEIIDGHEGDKYKTESKKINGFNLVESRKPKNAQGEMTREEIVVKYYYESNVQTSGTISGGQNGGTIVTPAENNNNGQTPTASKGTANTASTPNTGDIVPVIAGGVFITVLLLNIIQLVISKVTKKSTSKRQNKFIK